MALSRDGRFRSGAGTVDGLEIGSDGAPTKLGNLGDVPARLEGIAST